MRYLEWVWDPDPRDSTYVAEYAFLLRERVGSVRVVEDRHVEGLFARAEWLEALREAGFEGRSRELRFDGDRVVVEAFLGVKGAEVGPALGSR